MPKPEGILPPTTNTAIIERLFPPPHPYATDPAGWARDNGEHVISYQETIMQSVVNHKFTAVPACHGPGKSFIASRIMGWWATIHPVDSLIIWTAPTYAQVNGVIGRELRNLDAAIGLPGRITMEGNWYNDQNGLMGMGRKPADHDSEAFQGYHEKHILIVIDESVGMNDELWQQLYSLGVGEYARYLALGNPLKGENEFEHICAPDSPWNVIPISAYDTPAFTGEWVPENVADKLVTVEWVEEQIERWGIDHPTVQAKVFAKFPKSNSDRLYSADLIDSAITSETANGTAAVLCVDIARQGEDETVGSVIHSNGVVEELWVIAKNELMEIAGLIAAWHRDNPRARIVVDANGIGAGVYDRLVELRIPVTAFYGGAQSSDPKVYVNLRAESYDAVRKAIERGRLKIPKHMDTLLKQMRTINRKLDSKGRLQIESKSDAAKKGNKSPDRLDTIAMGVWALRLGRVTSNRVGMVRSSGLSSGGGYAT